MAGELPEIDFHIEDGDFVPGVEGLLGPDKTRPYKYDMSVRGPGEIGLWAEGAPFPESRGFGKGLYRGLRLNIGVVNTGLVTWKLGSPWDTPPGRFRATPLWQVATHFWRVKLYQKGTNDLVRAYNGFSVLGLGLPAIPGGTPHVPTRKQDVFLQPLHYTMPNPWGDYAMIDVSQVADGDYKFEFTLNPDQIDGANSKTVVSTLRINGLESTFNLP